MSADTVGGTEGAGETTLVRLPPPAHLAPLRPALVTAAGVRARLGVAYAALPGARPLELDLWVPPGGTEPTPVAVFLHGGGFRLGSRVSAGPSFGGQQPSPFERVALAGIAVASIDYRLSGEAQWPAQLHDVKAAVRWLRFRSDELGIDPERIAAWGESAGGHLAEMVGLTPDNPVLEGSVGIAEHSSRVSAVVAWYAPSDIAKVATDTGDDPLDPTTREAELLGAATGAVPELAAQASPVSYTSATAPPFLLLHGRDDRMVPSVQSERLEAALRDAGADVCLHLYDGANHMWLGAPEAAQDALNRTIAFLRHHLHLDPEGGSG